MMTNANVVMVAMTPAFIKPYNFFIKLLCDIMIVACG